jgi:signal transduction histidine kinase
LYIAKSLTELNHGKIWADSVEGKGSTFGFSLPKAS